MIKNILKCLAWPLLLIMLLIIGTEPVFSYPKYKKLFRDKYNVSGRINSCVICHSKGEESNLNSYGKSFLHAGATLDSFVRIEKLDSDKDGAMNLYEIKTYHYPGDGNDRPSEVELKRYLAGEMVSPHLERELYETLRCPCGCDETIDTCTCELMPELKKTIMENIEMRKDYDQIKKIMVKKYGVEILPLGENSETLSPSMFENQEIITAYRIASESPHILVELPCFCFCYGKNNRHESLLDCFKSLHGKNCKICIDEAVMVLKLQNEGLQFEEIEKEIVKAFR